MYESHFGFRQPPFSLTPDPRFLFLSGHHREALAHLLYGVGEGGGFVQLTGEVGTGKTTLCRSVLEQAPRQVDLALVLNPRLSPLELVATVCDELGVRYPDSGATSIKTLVDALTDRLLEGHAAGRRAVVVIDEAQNLESAALEQLRLLTNLETPRQKLLQIVLIGQPELQELMARPELRQLAQRITARYHLPPLSGAETAAYIRHRLRVAGGDPDLFTPSAVRQLHRLSGGVPRLINILCDRALLGGYAQESRRIGVELVRRAAREVKGETPRRNRSRLPLWGCVALAVAAVAIIGAHRSDLWEDTWATVMTVTGPGDLDPPKTPAAVAPDAVPAVSPPPETPASEVPAPEASVSETPASEMPVSEMLASETPASEAPVSETAALEMPAPPELTSDDLLQLVSAEPPSDPSETSLQLLSLWGVEIQTGARDMCVEAEAVGLRCYSARGNLTEVLRLNRPVILDLRTQFGTTYPLLLVGTEDDRLLWMNDQDVVRLSRQAIDPLWHGSFTLVWQPPPGGSLILGPGSEGRDVAWLSERLATLECPPGPVAFLYDEEIESRVRSLQQRFGLSPDGIAGRETIMQLNTTTNPGIPRLTPSPL